MIKAKGYELTNGGVVVALNGVVGAYLGLRVLYTALYMNNETRRTSLWRSATWITSVVLLMTVFVKTGNTINKNRAS
jgi:uncharacterized MAPEG superfamily protein